MPILALAQTPKGGVLWMLPSVEKLAKPLNPKEIDENIRNIIEVLRPECQRRAGFLPKYRDLFEGACLLEPVYKKLTELESIIIDPQKSPIHLPTEVLFPTYDLVRSGAWKKNPFIEKGPESAFELSADLILTRIVLQKALLAYVDVANLWTADPNNNAKIYLIPKLLQSLESQTILGQLSARYSSTLCSVREISGSSWAKLCQTEKTRTAYMLAKAFDQSRGEILRGLRILNLLGDEGDSNSVKQLAQLKPLSDLIAKLKSESSRASDLWKSVGSSDQHDINNQRNILAQQMQLVTKVPIQLSNQDQVFAYVYADSILRLQSLFETQFQVQSLAGILPQLSQELESDPTSKSEVSDILKQSKNQIQKLLAGVEYFALGQEQGQELGEEIK